LIYTKQLTIRLTKSYEQFGNIHCEQAPSNPDLKDSGESNLFCYEANISDIKQHEHDKETNKTRTRQIGRNVVAQYFLPSTVLKSLIMKLSILGLQF